MDCKDVRNALALWAGHDEFDDLGSVAEVRLHLQECADCRQLRHSLQHSQQALSAARITSDPNARPSLWVALAPQVVRQDRRPRRTWELQHVVPVALMSLACIIMVAVLLLPRGPGSLPADPGLADQRNLFDTAGATAERAPKSGDSPVVPAAHPVEPRVVTGGTLPGINVAPRSKSANP